MNKFLTIPTMESIEELFDIKFNEFKQYMEMVSNQKEDKWLNQKEAAKFLGISQNTIIQWKKKGKLTPYRYEGSLRYKQSDLINFYKQHNF